MLVASVQGGAHRRRAAQQHALGVLERCGMLGQANRPAAALTLLERKRLEMARALATDPQVLLLDEIAGGLTDAETDELIATIRQLRADGIAIIWIEHVIHALLRVIDRLVCLAQIDSRRVYAWAAAIAVATAGLAGAFFAMRSSFSPSMGPTQLLFAFEVVVIGGLGSLWGTLAGGMVLGIAQTVGAQADPRFSIMAGHVVFLAVLAFRPQGLLGMRRSRT